jgi:hypothetical protein
VHLTLDGNQYGITIFRHPQQEEEKGNKAGLMKTMGDGGHFVCCQRQKALDCNVEELRSREMSGMRFVG